MRKYEYIEVGQMNTERNRVDELNHYGKLGWRFCYADRIAGQMYWYFVREVNEEQESTFCTECGAIEGMPHVDTCSRIKKETYENRAELTTVGLDWDDAAVTFAQNFGQDGYDVEVCDHDGVIVKTFVHMHEWSGYVTPYINDRDAQGLINYLIGLNTTMEGERDGTTIR